MTLNEAELGKEYIIKAVETGGDEEMESFLFSFLPFSFLHSISLIFSMLKVLSTSLARDEKGTKAYLSPLPGELALKSVEDSLDHYGS